MMTNCVIVDWLPEVLLTSIVCVPSHHCLWWWWVWDMVWGWWLGMLTHVLVIMVSMFVCVHLHHAAYSTMVCVCMCDCVMIPKHSVWLPIQFEYELYGMIFELYPCLANHTIHFTVWFSLNSVIDDVCVGLDEDIGFECNEMCCLVWWCGLLLFVHCVCVMYGCWWCCVFGFVDMIQTQAWYCPYPVPYTHTVGHTYTKLQPAPSHSFHITPHQPYTLHVWPVCQWDLLLLFVCVPVCVWLSCYGVIPFHLIVNGWWCYGYGSMDTQSIKDSIKDCPYNIPNFHPNSISVGIAIWSCDTHSFEFAVWWWELVMRKKEKLSSQSDLKSSRITRWI